MAFHLVGVDLGGTKIATALTDTDSDIVRYETVPINPQEGADAIIAKMIDSIHHVTASVRPESILGIGVACAGQIEPTTGRVIFSPNLAWSDVPLGRMLGEALHWPVYVANDVGLAALGELHYGVARGKKDVVAVFVGTGIGAGLILNGQLYLGARGLAGELGQTTVRWDGPVCPGGNLGCLEHYASGSAMLQRAREALGSGRESVLARTDLSALHIEAIGQAAAEGDGLAVEIVDLTAEVLGAGVANVVDLLNPEMVILGGGVIRGIPSLVEKVGTAVMRRALSGARERLVILPAQFAREGGVIGATVFAKYAGQLTVPAR